MSNVIITGAAQGIGREMALILARQRARIVMADIQPEAAERTADEVRAAGGRALVAPCNVAEPADVEALAERAGTWFHDCSDGARPEVDLLVNNAGVLVAGELTALSLADHRRVIDVNLWGVVHGCHVFAPEMARRRHGRILNVASLAGALSPPRMGAYNATKAAVISLSETLAAELGPRGVSVTILCPSFTAGTALLHTASADAATMDLGARAMRLIGDTPREVAELGLAASARGDLYAIPGARGHLAWWAKRAAPRATTRALGWVNRLLG
jgi:NAD(P)-dependent dehydrogenase (short-subunit alcohol dehydrogenase family)